MRSVFVVGDSISIQYGPFLEQMLSGRIAYARKGSEDATMAEALRNLDIPVGANGGDLKGCCSRATIEEEGCACSSAVDEGRQRSEDGSSRA